MDAAALSAHPAFFIPVSAAIGMLIGSFVNVVAWRSARRATWCGLPADARSDAPPPAWWEGRSACPSCTTSIAAYDNIPVVSYIVLRGRCRHCSAAIPVDYVRTEAAFGIAFGTIAALMSPRPGTLMAMAIMAAALTWTAIRRERLLASRG